MGKVVDVSKGGIALQYLSFDAEDGGLTTGPARLEVFDRDSLCCLKEDACSIVYDFEMPRGNSMLGTYQLRLCGVRFGELSNDQYMFLDSIIHRQGFLWGPEITESHTNRHVSMTTGALSYFLDSV
jgi:hypothetical protein